MGDDEQVIHIVVDFSDALTHGISAAVIEGSHEFDRTIQLEAVPGLAGA
jgi:hypothetical protein